MMKNILLVQPGYNAPYPPLGLMKISTMHKRNGDRVQFIKHTEQKQVINNFGERQTKLKRYYNMIYITSLFTYQVDPVIAAISYYKNRFPNAQIGVGGIAATLLPEHIKQRTGIQPHIGLLHKAENCPPDYSLFPNLPYSISMTTRGCPRNCPFCAVKKLEPNFYAKEDWPKDIDTTKKVIIFWDNNWLYSPDLEKDVEILKKFQKKGIRKIDFNQGLDCRLFNKDRAILLSRLHINPLRFAFDNMSEDGYIQKTVRLGQKYGFKDIRVYVLYNSKGEGDTPEYFYYRINELNKLGALVYPMCYRPIDSDDGRYISPKWSKELLRALKLTLMFYYTKGMIAKSRESFHRIYGHSPNEFRRNLCQIYEKERG